MMGTRAREIMLGVGVMLVIIDDVVPHTTSTSNQLDLEDAVMRIPFRESMSTASTAYSNWFNDVLPIPKLFDDEWPYAGCERTPWGSWFKRGHWPLPPPKVPREMPPLMGRGRPRPMGLAVRESRRNHRRAARRRKARLAVTSGQRGSKDASQRRTAGRRYRSDGSGPVGVAA